MKNYRIEILPSAQSDIAEALDYIANDLSNVTAALKLHEVITESFDRLKVTPYCGRELTRELPLKYSYRWILAENYMLFYTVDENKSTVFIMRMLFGSSDYLSILNED